jgi:hypothetical protein
MHQERVERLKHACDLWIDHFEAYKRALSGAEEFIPVSYNRWLDEPDYRAGLAARFNISSEHDARETVGWGGGSSFVPYEEGQAAPSRAELESRWRTVANLAVYRDLFGDVPRVVEVGGTSVAD